jgi:hypothetical protein
MARFGQSPGGNVIERRERTGDWALEAPSAPPGARPCFLFRLSVNRTIVLANHNYIVVPSHKRPKGGNTLGENKTDYELHGDPHVHWRERKMKNRKQDGDDCQPEQQ